MNICKTVAFLIFNCNLHSLIDKYTMKALAFFILIFLCYFRLDAQNLIYIGNKTYPATETWSFGASLDVTIGKKSTGAYLMLTTYTRSKSYYIGGPVTIFLADGSIIRCTDRAIRDFVDSKSSAIYYFTDSEVKKLMEQPILKIRYSIIDSYSKEAENFTAECPRPFPRFNFDKGQHEKSGGYETDVEISQLFSE